MRKRRVAFWVVLVLLVASLSGNISIRQGKLDDCKGDRVCEQDVKDHHPLWPYEVVILGMAAWGTVAFFRHRRHRDDDR